MDFISWVQGFASIEEAWYDLGSRCSTGNTYGVWRNPAAAAALFWKAAERGHAEGQASLAQCYSSGFGVDRNDVLATEWTRRAGGLLTRVHFSTSLWDTLGGVGESVSQRVTVSNRCGSC
jgi:hypothetical protein